MAGSPATLVAPAGALAAAKKWRDLAADPMGWLTQKMARAEDGATHPRRRTPHHAGRNAQHTTISGVVVGAIFTIFRPPQFSQPNNTRFCVRSTRLVGSGN